MLLAFLSYPLFNREDWISLNESFSATYQMHILPYFVELEKNIKADWIESIKVFIETFKKIQRSSYTWLVTIIRALISLLFVFLSLEYFGVWSFLVILSFIVVIGAGVLFLVAGLQDSIKGLEGLQTGIIKRSKNRKEPTLP